MLFNCMRCQTDVLLIVSTCCLRKWPTVCELAGRSTSEEQRHGLPWRRIASCTGETVPWMWASLSLWNIRCLIGSRWSDFRKASCVCPVWCRNYNTRESVLNSLETIHVRFGDSVKNRVAIIQPRANNWTCNSVSSSSFWHFQPQIRSPQPCTFRNPFSLHLLLQNPSHCLQFRYQNNHLTSQKIILFIPTIIHLQVSSTLQ